MSDASPDRHQHGLRLLAGGSLAEALAQFDRALEATPQDAMLLYHHALALHQMGHLAEAGQGYERAAQCLADPVPALVNHGNALHSLGRHTEALALFDRAIARAPDLAAARYSRGMALQAVMRLAEATAEYDLALAADPSHAPARWNRALCRLALGDLAEGFAGHESGIAAGVRVVRSFCQPRWTGDALAGRTLLLHAEAGLGDTLQFCRYAPLLARQGHVILSVQQPLVRLLRSLDIPVISQEDRPPDFDIHAPLMSLPHLCATTLDNIPGTTPYLRADPDATARWDGLLGDAFRVGLVWAGAARPELPGANAVDQRRSISPAQMGSLGTIPGVTFVSLQKGQPGQQPPPFPMLDPTSLLADFADTAALVDALDLVISVDTSTAHLAGALGKPVWLLNRFDSCWRWMTDRTDTPWYPTMRLFRQPAPGDWASVMAAVVAALTRDRPPQTASRPR